MSVNNNIISECKGLAGICFGGYDNKVGWTKQCDFVNNTLYNNIVGIMVQQAEDNIISQNIIYGGENGLVFSFADEDGKLVYKGVGPYNDTNNFEQTIGMTRIVFQGITVGLICFRRNSFLNR